jgi:hypothetical protein
MIDSMKKFLLLCSGSNLAILGRNECAIEHNKYVGIGATILSTAVLASLSGGYAFYTVSKSVPPSILFGLLWGAIIFNLDRYIVSSIRKSDFSEARNAKERVALRVNELLRALPRLLLAIFISIVITKPLELRLFQREIDADIATNRITEAVDIRRRAAEEFGEIEKLRTENKTLADQIHNKEKQRNDLEQQKFAELDGWGGSRRPGDGPIHKEKQRAFARADSELKDLKKTNDRIIEKNDKQIATLTAQMEERISETKRSSEDGDGLLKRMETLDNIAAEHFTIRLASVFILLLFILLETAPIFVKLLSDRGPYDEIFESLEHEVRAHEQKKRFEVDDEMHAELSLKRSMRSRQLAAELELSRKTMNSLETLAGVEILEAQTEIAQKLAAEWKRAELDKIRFETRPSWTSGNGRGGDHRRSTGHESREERTETVT